MDPDAEKSTKVFDKVKGVIKDKKIEHIKCRGLKLESTGPNNEVYAQVEFLCANEKGVINVLTLLKELKGKIVFTYVRIMGDNHINVANQDIVVGQEGFLALMEAFAKGHFNFTYEFRFYNFKPETTPLLAFVDSLMNNQTLQTIGFARNRLNEDMCAAIL